jgi:hypothetical protein
METSAVSVTLKYRRRRVQYCYFPSPLVPFPQVVLPKQKLISQPVILQVSSVGGGYTSIQNSSASLVALELKMRQQRTAQPL